MQANAAPNPPENYAREFAFILFRRSRLIVLTLAAMIIAAAGVAIFWPPVYGAYGSILVKGRKPAAEAGEAAIVDVRGLPLAESDLYSELKIITSEDLYAQTLAALERRNRTDVLSAFGDEPANRLAALRKALEARVVPTSNVIEIALTGPAPDATLTLLQTLFSTYIRHRLTLWNARTGDFLAAQSESLRQQLADKTASLNDLEQRLGLPSAGKRLSDNVALQQELAAAAQQQATLIVEIESEIQRLVAARAGETVPSDPNEWSAQLEEQRERLSIAVDLRENLASKLQALAAEAAQLRQAQQSYDTLRREVETLDAAYEASVRRQMDSISVLVAPRLHERPVWPRPMMVLPAGVIAGGLLALALAFLREFLDHSFARPEDVRRGLAVPVLFSIPDGGAAPGPTSRLPRELRELAADPAASAGARLVPPARAAAWLIATAMLGATMYGLAGGGADSDGAPNSAPPETARTQ